MGRAGKVNQQQELGETGISTKELRLNFSERMAQIVYNVPSDRLVASLCVCDCRHFQCFDLRTPLCKSMQIFRLMSPSIVQG